MCIDAHVVSPCARRMVRYTAFYVKRLLVCCLRGKYKYECNLLAVWNANKPQSPDDLSRAQFSFLFDVFFCIQFLIRSRLKIYERTHFMRDSRSGLCAPSLCCVAAIAYTHTRHRPPFPWLFLDARNPRTSRAHSTSRVRRDELAQGLVFWRLQCVCVCVCLLVIESEIGLRFEHSGFAHKFQVCSTRARVQDKSAFCVRMTHEIY